MQDLLNLSPRRHIDYTNTVKISHVNAFGGQQEFTVRGEVLDLKEVIGHGPPRVP